MTELTASAAQIKEATGVFRQIFFDQISGHLALDKIVFSVGVGSAAEGLNGSHDLFLW